MVLKRIEKNWKDFIIMDNDIFMAEFLSFEDFASLRGFSESGNVALFFVLAA